MAITTDFPQFGSRDGYSADMRSVRAEYADDLRPRVLRDSETLIDWYEPGDINFFLSEKPRLKFSPPPVSRGVALEVNPDSTPLQIWEGTVVDVDRDVGVMRVLLDAKIGQMPRHSGDIELDSVSPQDQDLVKPGAVFYLTLYKRSVPSVENIQELRFRRRPSWSAIQLNRIEKDAAMFLSKMKVSPSAE